MYTDPSLKGDAYRRFVRRLLLIGVAKLCARPRARVGVFAVWRKANEHRRPDCGLPESQRPLQRGALHGVRKAPAPS